MPLISISGFYEPVSSISHLLFALVFFILTFFLMYRGRGNNARLVGLFIYSFNAIFLFSMSGVYHLLESGGIGHYVLRVLDHTAIYGMIAGSFTPLHLILFRGLNRWLILSIIWTVAITGLTMTAIFFDDISEGLMLSFFLGLGWMGLFSMRKIYELKRPSLFYLLLLGGVFYSLGAVFDFLRFPNLWPGVFHAHELFHFFVILGAITHWKMIYKIAALPISSRIDVEVGRFPDGRYEGRALSEHKIFQGHSLEELKLNIKSWVDEYYHEKYRPDKINLKIFDQDNL